MKEGTAKLAEDYCFIHEALRPVGKARRQIAAVPPSNSRPDLIKNRIAPTIEQQLSDSQYRFRAGRGNNGCNMSVANNGGKMSGNSKKHCTFVSLITPRYLTELSRSTRQRNKHNQKSLPPAESHSAI